MKENSNKIVIKNKSEVDLEQLVFNMIKELPERSKNIIIKRFNLNGDKKAGTLEKIGGEYKITRERVRQIESEAISNLRKMGEKYGVNLIFESIRSNIENCGGIAGEKKITGYLFDKKNNGKTDRQITLFILSLDGKIKGVGETKRYHSFYFYKKEDVEKFENIIIKIEKYLKKSEKDLDFDKMLEIAGKDLGGENEIASLYLKSYLDENKVVLKNILGRWGHAKWSHINPKNIKDKAYLALKKNEEPLHFVEIAKEISKLWQSDRIANSQTTHNELIKDDRVVLIGRGIYALREWGYISGTVLDVIVEILKESGDEMRKDDIIREVLKKRKVKKNTVVLNLQNKRYFEKMPNRIYKLK